jgi:hypothetical protein
MKASLLLLLLTTVPATALPTGAAAQQAAAPALKDTELRSGLLPVHVDARGGRILSSSRARARTASPRASSM